MRRTIFPAAEAARLVVIVRGTNEAVIDKDLAPALDGNVAAQADGVRGWVVMVTDDVLPDPDPTS